MKQKTKIVLSCFIGALIGVVISVLITIIISLTVHDGSYYAAPPDLIRTCGNEINAVILEMVLSLLYGAVWGGASWIWKIDHWSILRQTVTHLIICSAVTFPIAYLADWMPHNAAGIVKYFGIFVAVYLIIWFSQYSKMKKRVQQINARLNKNL
jgi:hypothetical protein